MLEWRPSWLDPQQYQLDTARMVREGAEDVYETFNLIVRRKPKENNFKSILECMRDLMSTKVSLPSWLEEVFLGYGDPDGAHWSNIEDERETWRKSPLTAKRNCRKPSTTA